MYIGGSSTPPSNTTPSKKPSEVQGPVERSTLDGRVKVLDDVTPFLAGKNLGQQLDMKGLKFLKMFFVHPRATFDLATGRLADMRQTDPVRYLEELADLSTRKSHAAFVVQEGNALKASHPRLKDELEGHQRTAVLQLLKHTNQAPRRDIFATELEDAGAMLEGISVPKELISRKTDFGRTLYQVAFKANAFRKAMTYEQLEKMQRGLSSIEMALSCRTPVLSG